MRAARALLVLTLDQVRSAGVRELPPGSTIHVCENPTVVEVVAERWARAAAAEGAAATGSIGPVLVCTSGQPSMAVVELLGGLAADGAELRYHGDFDRAGLRIARSLAGQVAWVPWRFAAADYRAAVRERKPSLQLTGRTAESPWCSAREGADHQKGEERAGHPLPQDDGDPGGRRGEDEDGVQRDAASPPAHRSAR